MHPLLELFNDRGRGDKEHDHHDDQDDQDDCDDYNDQDYRHDHDEVMTGPVKLGGNPSAPNTNQC